MSDRVSRLATEAASAAQIRALTTHPDVIALRVEKIRSQVDILLWAGIVLGLAFTMVNVQAFAAAGAAEWTLPWLAAWLLDPMVSVVLIAVLRAEQVTARYRVELTPWARRTKWLAFAATYTMNTWPYWGFGSAPFSAAGVVLHSVPPLVVFAAAETGPGLRDRLTEAVHRALLEHTTPDRAQQERAQEQGENVPADVPVPDESEWVDPWERWGVPVPENTTETVPAAVPADVPVPAGAVPETVPVAVPAAVPVPVPAAVPAVPAPDQGEHGENVTDEDILTWLQERAREDREVPGIRAIRARFPVGASRAQRLREQAPVPARIRSVK